MGRRAILASVLFVALPYKAPVLCVGVPDLTAIYAATFPADNAPGKWMLAACETPVRFPGFQLILHKLEYLRFNNCRMAVCYIILRNLTLIDLLLFGEEIHREFFLQKRVAFVFLVGENTFHYLGPPHLLSTRCRNPLVCEIGSNGR